MLRAVLRKKNRVTIPMEIIKQTGLKENDPLKVNLVEQQDGYSIVIEPLVKKLRPGRNATLPWKHSMITFPSKKHSAKK